MLGDTFSKIKATSSLYCKSESCGFSRHPIHWPLGELGQQLRMGHFPIFPFPTPLSLRPLQTPEHPGMLNMRIISSFSTSPIDLRGLPETLLPHKDFQTDIERD